MIHIYVCHHAIRARAVKPLPGVSFFASFTNNNNDNVSSNCALTCATSMPRVLARFPCLTLCARARACVCVCASRLALFNHSCDPNCAAVFDGSKLEIRALRPIPVGSEATISYVELAMPTNTRQDELQTTYHFTCSCARCTRNDVGDAVCGLLPQTTAPGDIQAMEAVCAPLQQAAALAKKEGDLSAALAGFKAVLEKQCELLAKTHWRVIQSVDLITDLLINIGGDWEEAQRYAEWSVQALTAAMPAEHPTRGIQLARAAKLQHHNGQLAAAIQCFTAALEVLTRSHGTDNKLIADLHKRLYEARAELEASQNSRGGRGGRGD